VAAAEKVEEAGDRDYYDSHMGAIFKEGFSFSGYERDLFSWNTGQGTFVNLSGISGADSISDGRGSVYADFDNDGDTDILLTTMQHKAHYLLRNNIGDNRHHLRVVLEGTRSGKDAFGTVVRIESTSAGSQSKVKAGGSGYISQGDGRLLFGLGDDAVVDRLEIVWPDGARQAFSDLEANRTLKFVEGEIEYEVLTTPGMSLPEPWTESQRLLSHTGLRIGQPLPDLPLLDLDGRKVKLSSLRKTGEKTLVNLWATWCTACVKEIPDLIAQRESLAAAGIGLIGISADVVTLKDVPDYVEKMGVDYPIVTTDERGMEFLFPTGETTVPLTVLLDAKGRVERAWTGWNATVEKELLALTK
jgi:peroxiredoxin